MRNPAAETYREMNVRSASPLGLVVMLHEAALKSLQEARDAVVRGDVEARAAAVNHTLAVIGELHASLNLEHGEVAQRLERFYVVMRGQVLEAGMKSSESMFRRLEQEFTLQRDAWMKVQQEVERSAVAAAPPPAIAAPASAAGHAAARPAPSPQAVGASWSA